MVLFGDSIVSKSEDLLFFLSLKCPTIILHYVNRICTFLHLLLYIYYFLRYYV